MVAEGVGGYAGKRKRNWVRGRQERSEKEADGLVRKGKWKNGH